MLKANPAVQPDLQWHTFDNFDALSTALSEQWLSLIQQASSGSSFALAGGSTPSPVYRKLDALLARWVTNHIALHDLLLSRWIARDDSMLKGI